MNDRDPFKLRQTSTATPLAFLRGSAILAVRTVAELQEKVEEYSAKLLDLDVSSVTLHSSRAGMSNPVARHNRAAQAEHLDPDSAWDSRHNTPVSGGGGVGEKIHDIFKTKDELPMYKDKPYNYNTSRRKLPIWRRPRLVTSVVAFFLLFLYTTGAFSSISSVTSGLSKLGEPSTTWAERRERVREAFKISWKAYEDNAWGMLSCPVCLFNSSLT